MRAWNISAVREFMNHLFLKDTFDEFELVEAVIVKQYTVTFGRGRGTEPLSYAQMRPHLLEHIKGKTVPETIRITLQMLPEQVEQISAEESGEDPIAGFLLNIRFDEDQLSCVTGVSYRTFSMERERERNWDQRIERKLRELDVKME